MPPPQIPPLQFLTPLDWRDYELLDSGSGAKLERFGPYRFVRPEPQAYWTRARPEKEWAAANGLFVPGRDDDTGGWKFHRSVPPHWEMNYGPLHFQAQATAFRHMGVFPEQAAHWDWAANLIRRAKRPATVLNLFGYTGLFSLAAAAAGATVTHVDASKKILIWARENQALSGLADKPIRWLLDDAVKFVRREVRRGSRYDGIIIDPPKFGRGPKGEIWKLDESLPGLLADCQKLLSDRPLFVLLSCYAIRASALSLYFALDEMLGQRGGTLAAGEVGVCESSPGERALSLALFARWHGLPEVGSR
jgi:23S rRNA (cytosine1962-C5)-methyltransferase